MIISNVAYKRHFLELNKQTVIMKPSVRAHELVANINYCAKLLGLELLVPKLRFVFRTWVTLFSPINYTIFGVYWTIRQTQQDWMDGLKSTIMLGGLINGLAEFVTVLQNHEQIKNLLNYTIEIYAKYETRGADYSAALDRGVNRMIKIRQVIRFGYIASFFVMLSVPWVRWFYDGTRITAMQYEIPGLPIETNFGFYSTYVIQVITASIAGVGFYMTDLLVLFAIVQILTFAHILQIKANTLNDALLRKEQTRYNANVGEYTDNETEDLLLNLIKWHQFFTDYCHHVELVYHNILAAQVISAAISILICFCVNLSGFHLISTIYLLISAYSMLVYCFVGTQIEYAYDEVYENICSISWQELKCDQRKMFVLMMKKAQSTKIMEMIGILPLSMGTALQITKLIYSISMMMMRNDN